LDAAVSRCDKETHWPKEPRASSREKKQGRKKNKSGEKKNYVGSETTPYIN